MKLMLGILFSISTVFSADNLDKLFKKKPGKGLIEAFVEEHIKAQKYTKHKANTPKDYELLTIGEVCKSAYLVVYLTTKNYKKMGTNALKVKLDTLCGLSDICVSSIGIDANHVDNSLCIFASLWYRGHKKLLSYYRCNDQERAILDTNYWIDLESPRIPKEVRLELLHKL